MFCTECGKEINQSFKFCPHCGHNLQQALSTIPSKPTVKEEISSNASPLVTSESAILAEQFGTIETKPNIYQNAKLRLRDMGRARGFSPMREYFFKETPQSPLSKMDIVWRSPKGFAAAFTIKSKNYRLEYIDEPNQLKRLMSFKADKRFIVNVSKSSGKARFFELTEDSAKTLQVQIENSEYSRSSADWTPEEDKQILEELSKGLTIAEIAEKHARQKGEIYSRTNKLINNKIVYPQIIEVKETKTNEISVEGKFTFLVKSLKNNKICLASLDENKHWVRPITAGGFADEDLIMDNGKQLEIFDVVDTKFDCRYPLLHHKENVKFTLGTSLHYVKTLDDHERAWLLNEVADSTFLDNVDSKELLFDEITYHLDRSLVLIGPVELFQIKYQMGDHHPRIWFIRPNKQPFSLSCTDSRFCKFIQTKLDNNLLPEGMIINIDVEELKDKKTYFVLGLTGDSIDVNGHIVDGKWHGKYWPLVVGVLTVPDYTK